MLLLLMLLLLLLLLLLHRHGVPDVVVVSRCAGSRAGHCTCVVGFIRQGTLPCPCRGKFQRNRAFVQPAAAARRTPHRNRLQERAPGCQQWL
jgi:hypothetical protein